MAYQPQMEAAEWVSWQTWGSDDVKYRGVRGKLNRVIGRGRRWHLVVKLPHWIYEGVWFKQTMRGQWHCWFKVTSLTPLNGSFCYFPGLGSIEHCIKYYARTQKQVRHTLIYHILIWYWSRWRHWVECGPVLLTSCVIWRIIEGSGVCAMRLRVEWK